MGMILWGIGNFVLGVANLMIAVRKEKSGLEAPFNWLAAFLGVVTGACLILINL